MNKAMQVFIGSLLGDGNIFSTKEGYISYSEIHSLKQKDYLLWKMNLMSELFNFAGSPYKFKTYDKRTKKEYGHIKINASDTKNLKKYYEEFYSNKKKVIPKEFLYKLSELGLAVWYQDDGNYNYGGYRCSIATEGFSYEEHLLIKGFLEGKYGIICEIYKKGKQFYIGFNRKESEKFLKLISSYIHKSMVYKLGHLDSSNEDKIVRAKKNVSKNKKIYYIKNREKIINYQREYRKNKKTIKGLL